MTRLAPDPSPSDKPAETRSPGNAAELPSSGRGAPLSGRGAPRSGLRWFWLVVGLPTVILVITVLALRWLSPRHPWLIALVGLTPFFALPLGFAGLSAWFSRNKAFRIVTAVTTAAFVLTVTPADAVIGCRATTAADEITIYSANVLADGGLAAAAAASIAANEPDVVVMQEVRWEYMQALRTDPRLSDYQFWSVDTPGLPTGDLIWSRWPLVDVTTQPFASENLVSATVVGPTGEFRVNNVHVRAPALQDKVWVWQQQHQMLSEFDQSVPTVLAGDFNASTDHQPFRKLLSAGWSDVHDAKGCGFDATWPVGRSLPFPVYRLDHVLVTEHFEVLDVRFGDPAGSDHKPVITSVRLR